MIAQTLIVAYEFADLVRKLRALPAAFVAAGLFAFGLRGYGLYRANCIRCRAQLVRRDMRDGDGLRSGIGCKLCAA